MVVDAGTVQGDTSMMYVVKENRKTRVIACQVYREIVKEGEPNYYQLQYEDAVSRPLLLDQNNQIVYLCSTKRGVIEKV